MSDARWSRLMRRAVELAEAGRYGASPNPRVGAVVLDPHGEVVGEGAHLVCGGPHAEIVALEQAGSAAKGGTLVVSLEPCTHFGRTPPCVDAVLEHGVGRVVVGVRDPNRAVSGGGVEALREAGIAVVLGIEEERCRTLNRSFFHWARTGTPFVTLKMAMTFDGKLASKGGRGQRISSPGSLREGYALREECDSILVGVGTVLADDPQLIRHLGLNPDPHLRRVVLDSRLRLPQDATLLRTDAGNVVVFCLEPADSDRRRCISQAGTRVVEVGDDGQGRCDLRHVLRWLGRNGTSSLLVEGGGEVHWSFLREGLAQRIHAFVAPMVLGGTGAVPAVGGAGFSTPGEAARLSFVEVRRNGPDLVIVADVAQK